MTFSKSLSAITILAALSVSASAWADLAPEDTCMQPDVGKACDNAIGKGTQFQPGVCTETMCTRASPQGAVSYTCYRCLAGEGGTGGKPSDSGGSASGGSASAGTSSGSGGTKSSTAGSSGSAGSGKSSGGCALAPAGGGAGTVFSRSLALLGLALAGLRRRRALSS